MTRQPEPGRRAGVIIRQGNQQGQGNSQHCLHWPRTLAQKNCQPLASHHLRWKQQRGSGTSLHCVLLDCSGSMVQGGKLALAKGWLESKAQQLYRQRGLLCVVGFNGSEAKILRLPSRAIFANTPWIEPICGGGGTPITQALQLSETLLIKHGRHSPDAIKHLYLLTDGRFTEQPLRPATATRCTIIDFENSRVALGGAAQLATQWDADYFPFHQVIETSQPQPSGGFSHAY